MTPVDNDALRKVEQVQYPSARRVAARAPRPVSRGGTSLRLSGRYEVACRDSDGRPEQRIETVADSLEEARRLGRMLLRANGSSRRRTDGVNEHGLERRSQVCDVGADRLCRRQRRLISRSTPRHQARWAGSPMIRWSAA